MGEETSAAARLAECERRLAGAADAPPGLLRAVRAAVARCRLPMRVAVVAQIKRGKSTLVNALLGQDVAPTAQLEATFTVGEFYDAPQPEVSSTSPSRRPAIIGRPGGFPDVYGQRPGAGGPAAPNPQGRIRNPEPAAERFRLLDTPGLGSIYQADSENTLMTLGVSGFLEAEERMQPRTGARRGRPHRGRPARRHRAGDRRRGRRYLPLRPGAQRARRLGGGPLPRPARPVAQRPEGDRRAQPL